MRKETIITLQDTNIKGEPIELTFKIKQMSALKQERWINRLVMLFLRNAGSANVSFNGGLEELKSKLNGKEGIAFLMNAMQNISYEDIEPLYDELLDCCSHLPNPGNQNMAVQCTKNNIDTIISDFKNLYQLRLAALKVNFSFFNTGVNFQQPQKPEQAIVFTKLT